MEYTIQHLSKSKIEIAINVSKEEFEADIKRAFEKNKHKFQVEGFRKGKVPMNIVEKRYGKGVLIEDGIDEALNRCYSKIIKDDNLNVVGMPSVDNIDPDNGLKAVITTAISPEFELGQYKGMTFKRESAEVSEDEIDAELNNEASKRARLIEKDGAVADGDTVNLDFSGSVDGVKFDGGTAKGHTLVIGSGQFIPGFEEQLVGAKKDEERDVKVTFPTEYHAENLAGKEAVFACKINQIQTKEVPAIDDDFIKDIDEELSTVEEYKNKIRKELLAKKIDSVDAKLENDIVEAISKNTEIDIPDCLIEEELDSRMYELEQSMIRYGMKLADYVKYTGVSIEEMKNEKREEAARNIKVRLILDKLNKVENLTLTAEEMNAEIEKLEDSEKNNDSVNYHLNKLMVDKLFAFLKANNTIE